MKKVAFLAHYYSDACLFASTEETRFYLNGAMLEPKGVVVATNGHILLAADASGDLAGGLGENVIIPANKVLTSACKSKSRTPLYLVIEAGEGLNATFRVFAAKTAQEAFDAKAGAIATVEGQFIDGGYPDWRRVLPKPSDKPEVATPAFNGEHLARFGKVSMAPKRGGTVRVVPGGESGPAFVDLGRDDAFGVIMPIPSDVKRTMPAWAK